MRDFGLFIGFAAGLITALLCGGVTWIVDDVSTKGNVGDAATWIGAIATTTVAYLAWKTARDAASTAREAHRENLTAEARSVDFEFLPQIFPERNKLPREAERLPPRAGEPDWEDVLEGGPPVFIVVNILNNNKRAMREGRLQLAREDGGPRILNRIRQGTSQYWFAIPVTWHSGEPVRRALFDNRAFAKYLEFTDSRDCRWRLAADGSLERIAIEA